MLVQEYNPKIVYVKGCKNIIADALSRIPTVRDSEEDSYYIFDEEAFAELLDVSEKFIEYATPSTFKEIALLQLADV